MSMSPLRLRFSVCRKSLVLGTLVFIALPLFPISVPTGLAAAPGLPFTEDFSDDALKDASATHAEWSAREQALYLAWKRTRYGAFGSETTGEDITADSHATRSVALGDLNGDGAPDLVAGNFDETNRLYLNNGTADPFAGEGGTVITADEHATCSVALGDVDGDGDLDLVAGNFGQANRLYLNNGTADPFAGATGTNVAEDMHDTLFVALGDMDNDGDLDLVAGNEGQANRLYVNNGTTDPFAGTGGASITEDSHATCSMALGDLDNDGDPDLVAGNNGQPNRLYLNNGTADPFAGIVGRNIDENAYATRSVALGDLDNDGDLDLATGNEGQSNRLYLNNGTTDPFAEATGSNLTADAHDTYSITLGDIDNDGDLDLAAGNEGQANRLYLNNGTADPFAEATGSDLGSDTHDTYSLALTDIDNDGDLDLVAGNRNQTNRLYANTGTTDPFAGSAGTTIATTSIRVASMALGDMDNDGDLDLVVGNDNYMINLLFLNNGTATPFSGATGANITSDAHSAWSVALGDLDNDGDLDLVAGNYGQTNRLYLNNGTENPFAGVSGSNISSDQHDTASVVLGDVDNDGDLDIVVGNFQQADRLYLNNGTAAPFAGVSGSDISSDAHQARSLVLGDVDNDGDLDIVVGNYQQANRLYLNNGTVKPFAWVIGSNITADAHNTISLSLNDMDNDGDLDLVAGNVGQANRLYLNNGTAEPFAGIAGSKITSDSDPTWSVVSKDVDKDGDLDLVVGNFGKKNRLYLNNDTADPFAGATGTDIDANENLTSCLALGDVDNDGDLDLVEGNFFKSIISYLINGTADPFAGLTGTDISSDACGTRSVAFGDVDDDGDQDFVAGNAGQANRLYLNNGTSDPFFGIIGTDIAADAHDTYSVVLGDVNRDGRLDLIAGNRGQANRLYLNDGTANPFAGADGTDIAADVCDTMSVAIGDVDNDGDQDLITGNQGQANRLYLNNGRSNPFAGATGTDIAGDIHDTMSVVLGDVDNDGDLDVVAGNSDDTNRLYVNNGTAAPFAGVSGTDIGADENRTLAVVLGDVDNDGDLDLVAGNDGQPNRLYFNSGTADPFAGATGTDISADAHRTISVVLGDLDGDGDLDLVAGNDGQADRLYLNNGTADPFAGATGTDISPDILRTFSLALADADKNGTLDLAAGNDGGANRLYQHRAFDTGHCRAVSLEVDNETDPIATVLLTADLALKPNTAAEFWLSNTGGTQWFSVVPDTPFTFPSAGTDLRWKVEMSSMSPVVSPVVTEIAVRLYSDLDQDNLPDYLENTTCTDPEDADTDDDGIIDGDEDADHDGSIDEGETAPCDFDTDGDNIQDGTERGIASGHPTDTDNGIFQPDEDIATTTDPLNPDTDGDFISDGEEDGNGNGFQDEGESDPNDDQDPIVDGDVDGDGSVDLTDAVLTIQINAGKKPSQKIYRAADMQPEGKIGTDEGAYIMGKCVEGQ